MRTKLRRKVRKKSCSAESPASCAPLLARQGRRWKRATAKFRVSFDGEWQEDFGTLDEAIEWAQEVSLTGRMTWVVERHIFTPHFWRLRAAFPEDRAEEARRLWEAARSANVGAYSG